MHMHPGNRWCRSKVAYGGQQGSHQHNDRPLQRAPGAAYTIRWEFNSSVQAQHNTLKTGEVEWAKLGAAMYVNAS